MGRGDAADGIGLGPLTRQGVDQLTQVQGMSSGLSGQLAQRIPRWRAEHSPHQVGHIGFGQWPERDQGRLRRARDARTCCTSGRRGSDRHVAIRSSRS